MTTEKTIYNAHVKEFETVCDKNDLRKIKWIKVTLQVMAAPGEHHHITEFLTEYMDKDLPRFLKFSEQ